MAKKVLNILSYVLWDIVVCNTGEHFPSEKSFRVISLLQSIASDHLQFIFVVIDRIGNVADKLLHFCFF